MTDYLDGALSAEERARFEGHLRDCDGCTTYVEQIRETVRLTGRLGEDGIPPAVRDALLEAFRNWKRA